MSILFKLAFEFFKTGLFAFGGGLATIPFLEEMGTNFGWFSVNTLTTMIAISESTPGPMGVNMATYVGYHTYGIVGGIITSLALVAPSIIVVCIIASMYDQFKQSKVIQAIFRSLRPAVVGFIISACIGIFLTTLFNIDLFNTTKNIFKLLNFYSIITVTILLIMNHYKKINPIYTIIGCAIIGIILKL